MCVWAQEVGFKDSKGGGEGWGYYHADGTVQFKSMGLKLTGIRTRVSKPLPQVRVSYKPTDIYILLWALYITLPIFLLFGLKINHMK
jgi:hypothetical protein